jgi:hypothetical protein
LLEPTLSVLPQIGNWQVPDANFPVIKSRNEWMLIRVPRQLICAFDVASTGSRSTVDVRPPPSDPLRNPCLFQGSADAIPLRSLAADLDQQRHDREILHSLGRDAHRQAFREAHDAGHYGA